MKRTDILYGLELVIFKYERKYYDYDLLDTLMDKGYVDWYGWYDDKKERFLYSINATQKGLWYYATHKHKSRYKGRALLGIIILLLPLVFMLT
jgi:hypothetical protein